MKEVGEMGHLCSCQEVCLRGLRGIGNYSKRDAEAVEASEPETYLV